MSEVKAQPEILKDFPILNSKIEPKTIPAMHVYLHADQCERNHRQSVNRLAERSGLSWCELFAVLHNMPWRSMNEQEARDGCIAVIESPEHIAMAEQLKLRMFAQHTLKTDHEDVKKKDVRHRFVWLNLADGSFSESWQEGEHPPESSLHEEKLAAEANERAPLFKLIKYVCMNDGSFAFDHHMKLR